MSFTVGVVILALSATVVSSHSTPPPTDFVQDEDYEHVRPPHDERFNGHLAHYITLSKLTFSNLRYAKAALHDIHSGTRTFLDFAKDLSIGNAKAGRQNPALQNGDLGLVTYDLLEEELAEVAFDIRYPISKSSKDIIGPICSASGCSLMAVFSRFRRGFFSDAWWEAEQYCKDHDMQFSELLQRLGTDSMSLVASVIWPHEHVVFKKLKLRQLKSDLKRLNEVDPSTVFHSPNVPAPRSDLSSHNKLMRRREELFASIDAQVLADHSEIFAMSIAQMVKHGFVSQELVDAVEAAALKEERAAEQAALDDMNEFELVEGTKIMKRKAPVKPSSTSSPVEEKAPPVEEQCNSDNLSAECANDAAVKLAVEEGEW